MVTRMARSGDRAVQITNPYGSKINISAKRIKAYVPNTHLKAPAGTMDKVKFLNAQPSSNG